MAKKITKVAQLAASVNNGEYPVEGLVINLAVGSSATASIVGVPKSDNVVAELFTNDVITTLRERQQRRLAGRFTPDITVTASDGIGGNLTFKGFMAAPALDLSQHQVGDKFSALGVDSLIDGLDLGIYRADPPTSREETSTGSLEPLKPSADGDVPALLSSITDTLLANYDIAVGEAESESERMLLEQQHAQNLKAPLALWKAILDNSDVVYEKWAEAASMNESLPFQMATHAQTMLQQPTSGFWSVINGLLAGFQMIYIPSVDGSGQFRRMDVRVSEEVTQTIELSVTALNILDGSQRIMQIGGVVMMAPSVVTTREETTGPPSIAGQHPRPLIDGYIHREPPPLWLVDAQGVPIVGSSIDDTTDADADADFDFDIDAAKGRKEEAAAYGGEQDTANSALLDEICKVFFLDYQYADSTGSFSTPLNFNLRVGERTQFNIPGGGSFVGFVNAITHRIDLRMGKELDSVTQLDVTHIKY